MTHTTYPANARRLWLTIGAVLAASAMFLGMSAQPANAIASNGIAGNTFFAYLEPGETLSYSFVSNSEVTITNPLGEVKLECGPGTCTGNILSQPADDTGVWLVKVQRSGDNLASWHLRVLAEGDDGVTPGSEIEGRIWNEVLMFANNGWGGKKPHRPLSV